MKTITVCLLILFFFVSKVMRLFNLSASCRKRVREQTAWNFALCRDLNPIPLSFVLNWTVRFALLNTSTEPARQGSQAKCIMQTRKSSSVNARGIPPARGRKMLTPPAGPDPSPRLDLTPPGWIDLWPDPPSWIDLCPPGWIDLWPDPPAGLLTFDPDPPAGLTFDPDTPPAGLTFDLPPAGLTFDLIPPAGLTFAPPAGLTFDLTPPQVWTDWKHYLPHPSDAGGNNPSLLLVKAQVAVRSKRSRRNWKITEKLITT